MDHELIIIAKFINNLTDFIPQIKKVYVDSKND